MTPEQKTDPRKSFELLAFDAAPVGLVLTEHRVIMACNQTFCTLSGYARADLLGQSFRMLYTNDQEFDRIRDVGITTLKKHGDYSDQRLLRRKDGSAIWCRFRAHALDASDPLSQTVLSYAGLNDAPDLPSLSNRERDVVQRLSQGLTSKAIAHDLGLSARTIEDVRARLLKKLKVRNAAEMLALLTNIEF